MKFQVTKRDIKDGERESSNSCPIALAIRRKLKLDEFEVYVTQEVITYRCCETQTPKRLADFIADFDDGEAVKPFTFSLPL